MRGLLYAAALLGAGCSPTAVSIEANLDALALPAAGMVVVALVPEDQAQPTAVFKHRLPTDPISVATFRDIEGAPSLVVAAYVEDDLNLPDGALNPVAPSPGRVSLRVPDQSRGERVYQALITDEKLGAWNEEDNLPPAVRDLRFEASECPCLDLSPSIHALGPPGVRAAPGVAVALSDDRALVSTRSGEYYAVGPEGLETLELPRGLPNSTAIRTAAGVIWLFGAGGRAARTSTASELAFVNAPSDPSQTDIRRAVATEGPSGTIIYTYGGSRISAFDGTRWVLVYDEPEAAHWHVDMEAVSASEVWTASGNRPTLTRIYDIEVDFEAGTARSEVEVVRPSAEPSQAFSTLAWLPGLGLIAGSQGFGELFAGDRNGFEELPRADVELRTAGQDPNAPTRLGTRSYGLETLGNGVFGVGALGASVQFHPGFGFCNFDRFSGDGIVVLAKVGEDLVFLTEHEVRTASAVYLRRRGPSGASTLCGRTLD